MPIDARRLKGYKFSESDRLFFDTNVWICIYGPPDAPGDTRAKVYSNALKRAHAAGSSLHIDIVVLGEFVNRCLRLEHRMLRSYDAVDWDYKVYRASPEYAASVVQVSRNALSILSYCRPIESGFSRCNLTALLGRFGAGQSDLSDEFIVATCQREGYTLVTDDADFVHSDLKILTRNARYFSRA